MDILHNNAGIGIGAPVEKHTLEDWEKIIDINLWGVIYGPSSPSSRSGSETTGRG